MPRLRSSGGMVAISVRCSFSNSLQGFALQRNSDAVAVMPEPLLGNPETRDLVAIDNTELQPHDLELVMLKPRPRAGLTQCAVFDCKEPSL